MTKNAKRLVRMGALTVACLPMGLSAGVRIPVPVPYGVSVNLPGIEAVPVLLPVPIISVRTHQVQAVSRMEPVRHAALRGECRPSARVVVMQRESPRRDQDRFARQRDRHERYTYRERRQRDRMHYAWAD
jgi:hypothetical protein